MKRILLLLACVSALQLSLAHADLISDVQNTDESTIRSAGLVQADRIRQLPSELRAQGVEVSPTEEAKINHLADDFTSEANQPGFKRKVVASMKKIRHGLARAGIDTLKGIGYAGDAAFYASLAPLAFGADFLTGVVVGRGSISTGAKSTAEGDLGGLGGCLSLGFTYTGLASVGFTLYGPILGSSLGVLMVDGIVCKNTDEKGKTERAHFCRNNDRIKDAIVGKSARAGEILGDGVHRGIRTVVHGVEYPFRSKADGQEDDLGN